VNLAVARFCGLVFLRAVEFAVLMIGIPESAFVPETAFISESNLIPQSAFRN
jgi:hypothetical protein